MTDLCTFDHIHPSDGDAVGGKGLGLGLLARAGLPVPPGFCVTSAAYRRLQGQAPHADAALAGQIREAYRRLGGGAVAVRSSATAEDGAGASFAGQQQTCLGVTGADAVLDAVARCWASLQAGPAVAYRRRQGVDERGLAMAVVVQQLVAAEVAGVLFTRDPLDPTGRRMLVEASWGLGEAVVSGRVTPDRYHLDRDTGAVLDRQIGSKRVQIADGRLQIADVNLQAASCKLQYTAVPPEKQDQPCLDDARLAELAGLGRRVEALFGDARDIEWAWAAGRFWLLQARPITAGAADRERVRREEIAALAARVEPGGTAWSRCNLAEVLPEPTPLTWAVVRRFLSGRGGFGLMYRDLGCDPDPALDDAGIFDLVCGRPYCNLSRQPRMQSRWLPLENPFAALKADPRKALAPRPVPNPARAAPGFWLRLPWLFVRSIRAELRLQHLSRTLAGRLRQEVLPAFAAETAREAGWDVAAQATPALLERLEYWVRRTLYDFARDSLKPTVLADLARGRLEVALARLLGPERARAAVGELLVGVRPDPEADLAGAVRDLAEGRLDRAAFLERFGHRGSQEMELAQPRWAEDPGALDRLLAQASRPGTTAEPTDPAAAWDRIAAEAKLTPVQRAALEGELSALQTYLGLRETAKHYLMKGYALIRRLLVELDRRHGLGGGVFYLTPDELPRLVAGADFTAVIAGRRRRRALALSLEVPLVLFSDDLEAIGRPAVLAGADTLQGVPLSAGVAEGPALVLHDPAGAAVPAAPYILVCPSTDPAWVPLFMYARALVMETGGVLSHGAIVAREFGLPAVAGLPDVHRRLHNGQRLRVDGGRGTVVVLAGEGGGLTNDQ